MSCKSLTAAWVKVFVFSVDLFAPALFETFEIFLRGKNFSGSVEQDILCAIALWLLAFFFSSRTLPETRIAIEASEAKFLFSYVIRSLSSILFSENSAVPQCMSTFIYLGVCCKNCGCFWLNWFLVFSLTCNLSCPSPFSFNQLLKSKSVGRCKLCLTVCIDQAYLRLGVR